MCRILDWNSCRNNPKCYKCVTVATFTGFNRKKKQQKHSCVIVRYTTATSPDTYKRILKKEINLTPVLSINMRVKVQHSQNQPWLEINARDKNSRHTGRERLFLKQRGKLLIWLHSLDSNKNYLAEIQGGGIRYHSRQSLSSEHCNLSNTKPYLHTL